MTPQKPAGGSMMIFVAVLIAGVVEGGGGVPIRAPTNKRSAERAREKGKDSCARGPGW